MKEEFQEFYMIMKIERSIPINRTYPTNFPHPPSEHTICLGDNVGFLDLNIAVKYVRELNEEAGAEMFFVQKVWR